VAHLLILLARDLSLGIALLEDLRRSPRSGPKLAIAADSRRISQAINSITPTMTSAQNTSMRKPYQGWLP
jgi:hypothetical protein